MSAMGVLDWHLQEGGVNGSDLCLFAERCLVPHLRPFPQPHSVLVLDNCATHHTAAFTELIEATGALTVFLPPYSPELNPTELVFSKAKAWLRRNVAEVAGMDPFRAMHEALSSITVADCRGFIRKCGAHYCKD